LLDTGASHTLIPHSLARRLKLQPHGKSIAQTANGKTSFAKAVVGKLEFGRRTLTAMEVSIAQGDLSEGLLGQDAFGDLDVTIGQSSITFGKPPPAAIDRY
jgi:predicted aspartyl protease